MATNPNELQPVRTSVHSQLYELLSRGNDDDVALQRLLNAGANVREMMMDPLTRQYTNPLYLALAAKQTKCVTQLMTIGNGVVLQDNTILMAIERENIIVLSGLVELGVDLNIPYLIPGGHVNRLPLQYAIERSSLPIFQLLISSGADLDHLQRTTGASALEHAGREGNFEILRDIIRTNPANVSQRGEDGLTVLHRLIINGVSWHDVLIALIEAKTPLDTVEPNSHRTVLNSFLAQGQHTLFRDTAIFMINRGLKPTAAESRQHPEIGLYYKQYCRFVKAYNRLNFTEMKRLQNSMDVNEFAQLCHDAANGRLPEGMTTACNKRWLKESVLGFPAPEGEAPRAAQLHQYQTELFASAHPSRKKKGWEIARATEESKKMHAAVQLRTKFFPPRRGSLLSEGGQELVRLHPEFQSIHIVIEWVQQYSRYLKTKINHGDKCLGITKALETAIAARPNIYSTNPEDIDNFLKPGLRQAINLGRWSEGPTEGWKQFLSIFTEYAGYLQELDQMVDLQENHDETNRLLTSR